MFYDVDEIYHYGIKRKSGRYPYGSGDKWGKKKNDPKKGKSANKENKIKKKKELTSKQVIDSRSVKTVAKNTKKLTDQELRDLANRFQAEATIKELAKKSSSINRGKKFLAETADTSEKINKIIKSTTGAIMSASKFIDFISKKEK